jgi:hypothetical protein
MKMNYLPQAVLCATLLIGGISPDSSIATDREWASAARSHAVRSDRDGERENLQLLSAGDLVDLDTVTSFVSIPGMSTEIYVDKRDACITAVFSAEVSGLEIHFRALLDNELMEGHRRDISALVHATTTGIANLVSYTFWICDVRRGRHTVTIEWRTPRPNVAANGRTLVVEVR